MPRITPLPESEATDKAAQTYGRIKEMLGGDSVPEPFLAMGRVPAFLSDFYMNYKKFVHGSGKLDERTRTLIGLAVAAHGGGGVWFDWFGDRAATLGVTQDQVAEVVALVATNATYNTFFKFRELAGGDTWEGLPVGLRAHTFSGVSIDPQAAELIHVVISDLNACKPCVSGHVKKARELGLTDEQILESIQCGATVKAGVAFVGL